MQDRREFLKLLAASVTMLPFAGTRMLPALLREERKRQGLPGGRVFVNQHIVSGIAADFSRFGEVVDKGIISIDYNSSPITKAIAVTKSQEEGTPPPASIPYEVAYEAKKCVLSMKLYAEKQGVKFTDAGILVFLQPFGILREDHLITAVGLEDA